MSIHSYSKIWMHLIWNTYNKQKLLPEKEKRKSISNFLYEYSESKKIFMKTNYVNAEHVHALIDLPTGHSIEEVIKLLKGASSYWINKNQLAAGKFSWGRGYGVFSVSQEILERIMYYIKDQEQHHRKKSFQEEYEDLLKEFGEFVKVKLNR